MAHVTASAGPINREERSGSLPSGQLPVLRLRHRQLQARCGSREGMHHIQEALAYINAQCHVYFEVHDLTPYLANDSGV